MERYKAFPFKLDTCVWEITLACCFNCPYCGSRGGKARENELTTAECDDVARQLAEMGCRRVSLIGGEVFMRKDWEKIVNSLTSRGIITCIITNGYTMTEEITSALKRLNIESVAVSIDGVEQVHDAYRQNGSYKRAFKTLQSVADAGIPVSVISALRADNAPRLREFYEVLLNTPIFAWQIQACSPMGNADSNKINVEFDSLEVIKFIKSVSGTAPFDVAAADNIGYFTPEEKYIRRRLGSYFGGCSAGLTTIGIDSVGNVRGCESMYDERFNEGNLRERTLVDIWTDKDAFSYNRSFTPDKLTSGCSGCEYGSICAGGCRSYNYFSTGKLYENPLCALNK